jgi:hypothetical protein
VKVGRFTRSDEKWKRKHPPGNPAHTAPWSLTWSHKGGNITGAEWTWARLYADTWCEAAVFNREPGDQERNIHIQAVFMILCDKTMKSYLADHIKLECGIMPGSGRMIKLVFMEGNHSPSAMIGYVGKNKGNPGFARFKTLNISDEQEQEGDATYAAMNTGLFKGRHPCGPHNFLRCLVSYCSKTLSGFHPPPEVAMACMVHSLQYAFMEGWGKANPGAEYGVMIYSKVKLLVKAAVLPSKFTVGDSCSLFFSDGAGFSSGQPATPRGSPPDSSSDTPPHGRKQNSRYFNSSFEKIPAAQNLDNIIDEFDASGNPIMMRLPKEEFECEGGLYAWKIGVEGEPNETVDLNYDQLVKWCKDRSVAEGSKEIDLGAQKTAEQVPSSKWKKSDKADTFKHAKGKSKHPISPNRAYLEEYMAKEREVLYGSNQAAVINRERGDQEKNIHGRSHNQAASMSACYTSPTGPRNFVIHGAGSLSPTTLASSPGSALWSPQKSESKSDDSIKQKDSK